MTIKNACVEMAFPVVSGHMQSGFNLGVAVHCRYYCTQTVMIKRITKSSLKWLYTSVTTTKHQSWKTTWKIFDKKSFITKDMTTNPENINYVYYDSYKRLYYFKHVWVSDVFSLSSCIIEYCPTLQSEKSLSAVNSSKQ